jgi:hypothetical protein
MRLYSIIFALLLALAAAPCFAADKLPDGGDVVHGGGLVCFSILPPRDGGTCDRLCAAKNAACVGLKTNGAMSPGYGCGNVFDPKLDGGYVAACRCCALDHR